MLLRYVLNDFEYIPGAPFITGVTFVFKILLLSSSSSLTSPNRIIGLSFFWLIRLRVRHRCSSGTFRSVIAKLKSNVWYSLEHKKFSILFK